MNMIQAINLSLLVGFITACIFKGINKLSPDTFLELICVILILKLLLILIF